ncbi:hypothetical protein AOQ73_15745 [Bradyrhizobium pachyrhizi]|nr:hypothetical protein AOQ73_15745 [Bradyrhizobium pachyrhizi]
MQGSVPMMGVLNQAVSITGEDVAADSSDEPRNKAKGGDHDSNYWGKRHVMAIGRRLGRYVSLLVRWTVPFS